MKRFYACTLFALSLFACNESGQWQETNSAAHDAALKKGNAMASPVTAASYGGTLPVASILAPNDGDDVVAQDLREAEAALLAECDDIRSITTGLENDKVDRAGDTMTGQLLIAPSSGGTALVAGSFTGSNAPAAQFVGDGTGAAAQFIGGATGPGAQFTSGAGAAGEAAQAIGYVRMAGTSIASNTDPGADNTIWPQSINSSSCTITTNGAGNAAVQTAGFNVNTVSIFGIDQLVVTFKRTLPGSAYRVALGEYGPYKVELVNGSRATTGYTLKVRDLATNLYVNLTTTAVTVFVTTTGF